MQSSEGAKPRGSSASESRAPEVRGQVRTEGPSLSNELRSSEEANGELRRSERTGLRNWMAKIPKSVNPEPSWWKPFWPQSLGLKPSVICLGAQLLGWCCLRQREEVLKVES